MTITWKIKIYNEKLSCTFGLLVRIKSCREEHTVQVLSCQVVIILQTQKNFCREAESYVSHYPTNKRQCMRLGSVSSLNCQAATLLAKMTRVAVSNRLAFLYVNVPESTQS